MLPSAVCALKKNVYTILSIIQAVKLYAEVFSKNTIDTLAAHHSGKVFLECDLRQRIASFHGEFYLFDMFHAETFSADYAYTYCFTILIILKAIVTFQHT